MALWEYNGIRANGARPSLVGAYENNDPGGCIVLGTSREAWKDLDEARALFNSKDDFDIIAVNDIAHQFRGEIAHMCSLHKEILGPMRQIRKVKIFEDVHTHSARHYPGVDHVWGAIATGGGTSGMFGVKIALAMGYKKIIVAGIGVDETGHYYDPVDHRANGSGIFDEACRQPWRELRRDNPEAKKRVRIMSGKLMELYGRPERSWIYEKVAV